MIRLIIVVRFVTVHPKVKLYIGHGGISGVYEAVDAGVPVIGFPFFYDQPKNLKNLVDAGMAISLDWFSLTEDTFFNAIISIVNNETYAYKSLNIFYFECDKILR